MLYNEFSPLGSIFPLANQKLFLLPFALTHRCILVLTVVLGLSIGQCEQLGPCGSTTLVTLAFTVKSPLNNMFDITESNYFL